MRPFPQEREPRQQPADLLTGKRSAAECSRSPEVGRVRLSNQRARDARLAQARVRTEEFVLVARSKRDGVRVGGKVAGRTFASGVNQLRSEVAERQVCPNQDVVIERLGRQR